MENISHLLNQEIIFASSDSTESMAILRALKVGKIRKLTPRLYSNNLKDKPETIIKRNLYLILGHLYPGAVISHRSALEGGPKKDTIFLTYKYTKKQSLPGITIRLLEGKNALADDAQFMKGLFFASQARALLENMQASRGEIPKSISQKEIEQHLDKIASLRGIEELNSLRDQAKKCQKHLACRLSLRGSIN